MFFSSMSFLVWSKLEAFFSLLNQWRLVGHKWSNEPEPGLDVLVELPEGPSHVRVLELPVLPVDVIKHVLLHVW